MAMTGRPDHDLGLSAREVEVKHTWQLVEQHGLGWAYDGELPPPEAFQTHNRPGHLRILGPYPSRVVAETLLRRIRAALPLRWRGMSRARLRELIVLVVARREKREMEAATRPEKEGRFIASLTAGRTTPSARQAR